MTPARTQKFFHQYAGDFNAIYSNHTGLVNDFANRWFRRSMKLRFEKTIEGCWPIEGKTILDVGCGPGHYAITLARRGAASVTGIDFAKGMLDLATRQAKEAGVNSRCTFATRDFETFESPALFDYVILMGFMDYMPHPKPIIEKALSLSRHKVFFSFPAEGGLLAWQRKMRYRRRCDLYLYSERQIRSLVRSFGGVDATIEPIARDFFVTLSLREAKL